MNKIGSVMLTCVAASAANAFVVPNGLANVEGDGTFALTTTNAAGRTYQQTIAASQLTGLAGMTLTGMSFRLNGGANPWPATAASFASWDIFIGPGVAPSAMSNTFADNFSGTVTQVRSGALSFAANSFPSGGVPNAFGPVITFNSGYLYTGGNLTIETRFSAQTGLTTQSPLDGVTASGGPANGWGVDFAGRWTGNMAGTAGNNGNFLVTELQAVPEPTTLAALGLGALALIRKRRSR